MSHSRAHSDQRPLLKVRAECPSFGPGNALANVEIQASTMSQIRDKFGCVSQFYSTRLSQWSCASLRLCSSRALEFPCLSDWVLAVVLRETNGRVESKEGCTILDLPHVDLKVVLALFTACQGNAGGCVAWDVRVAVVEVTRTGPQPADESFFWPRRWVELHNVDLKR